MCEHGNEFSKLPVKRDPSVVDYRNTWYKSSWGKKIQDTDELIDVIADYPDITASILREALGGHISDQEIIKHIEDRYYDGNSGYNYYENAPF